MSLALFLKSIPKIMNWATGGLSFGSSITEKGFDTIGK